MLQQNSGYRSNDPSLWSGEHYILGSGIINFTVLYIAFDSFSSFLIPSPHTRFPFPPLFFQLWTLCLKEVASVIHSLLSFRKN